MKKNIFIIVCMLLIHFAAAQSPGGVSSNLVAWFKENPANTNTSWKENSSANNATGTATYNTSGADLINFNPSYTFNGTSDNLNFPTALNVGGTAASGYTLFGVSKLKNTTAGRVFSTVTGNNLFGHYQNLEGPLYINGSPSYLSNGSNGVIANTLNTNFFSLNRTGTSGAISFRKNGSVLSTAASSDAGSWQMCLGAYNSSSERANVIIPEFISYSAALSSGDQSRVESYLAIKYGSTLNQTTAQNYVNSSSTVIWDATANSGYKNNIAGIARDDASGLNQKQSSSVNSGIQPVIGNINIADTNANNTNSFTADLSALVWGSDTGVTNFNTAFAFGGLNNRMTRIWKVQETGTVGTVKVALPASQVVVSNPTLVVSADATFDGTDTRTAMTLETIGGLQYYTATVDFATVQFFTFAGYVNSPGGLNSNLVFWYKADAGVTTSGTSTTVWKDSYNGYDAVQSTSTAQPTYNSTSSLFNYNPTLSFDAGDNLKTTSTLPGATTGINTYVVYLPNASATYLWNWASGGQGYSNYDNNSATDGFRAYSDNIGWLASTSPGLLGIPVIGSVNWNNTAPGSWEVRNNGLQNATLVNNTTAFTNIANGTSYFNVGGTNGGAGYNGRIAEVIGYNSKASSTDRLRVESYLALKYGITLPGDYTASNGTTKFWTSDATYQNTIFGIVKDDNSGLHQKVSKSSIFGFNGFVTLSTDSDFASSNASAGRTAITNDLASLVIGDNNASKDVITTSVAAGYNYRLDRQWKVKKTTAFSQAVYLNFQGFNSNSGFTWYVVKRNNNTDLSTGVTQVSQLDASGSTITPITFADNDYFTIMAVAVDSDNDGVPDFGDLDDDNDGILDDVECSSFTRYWASPPVITGTYTATGSAGPTGAKVNYIYTSSTSLSTTVGINNFAAFPTSFGLVNQAAIMNQATNTNTIVFDQPVLNPTFMFASIGQAGVSVPIEFSKPISVQWSQAVVQNSPTRITGTEGYAIVTVPGLHSSVTFNYLTTEYFCNFQFGYSVKDPCDTDGDGISDSLDLDSDNDGCLDAIEGAASITTAQLVTASGTVSVGTGSSASNKNLCAGSTCVDTNGIPQFATLPSGYSNVTGQAIGSSQNSTQHPDCPSCYKPAATVGITIDSKHGITALGRAGSSDVDNWPMVRKGAWTVLEAKTKGFVINRLTAAQIAAIPAANLVEGMTIYDTTNNCLKIYTSTDGGTTYGWKCINTQTCPD